MHATRPGDILVELDTRQAAAELKLRQAVLAIAQEQLRKLKLQPRPEEVPASEAQVEVAEANLRERKDLHARAQALVDKGAMSQEDFVSRKEAYQSARAQLALAKPNLVLLKAGKENGDI